MFRCMRTTLTIEDDVAARLEKLLRARDITLKSLINQALRRGLDALEQPPEPEEPYVLTPRHLGRPRFAGMESVADMLAVAEGEGFR